MKKLLIISFAVAVLAIGGGVFIHTALIGSDPILLCLKSPMPGDKWYHDCSTCRPGSYSVSTMALCYK